MDDSIYKCMKKIALLFLVHKSPEQFAHLLRRLDDGRFDFYIHVDAKSDINQFLPVEHHIKKSHVHWIFNRVKTYFNDFSLVEATYNVMKAAYRGDYLYYVLLTGQDYPIKSNDYIYKKLYASYPTAYIDMYGVNDAFLSGVKWVENIGYSYFSQSLRKKLQCTLGNKFYYSSYGRIVKILPRIYDILMTHFSYSPRKRIKETVYTYSAGSHFWILPDVAVRHIINVFEHDTNINDIFRHIAAPEESYFQTVLSSMDNLELPDNMLAQFENVNKEMDNPALRLIKWYENGKHTNGHPAIWNMNDIPIIGKAEALYARKLDISIDSRIIEYLDTKYEGTNY